MMGTVFKLLYLAQWLARNMCSAYLINTYIYMYMYSMDGWIIFLCLESEKGRISETEPRKGGRIQVMNIFVY